MIIKKLMALCLAAAAVFAYGEGEPKSVTITGLDGFEGRQATAAVLARLFPHAGGAGRVQEGAATIPLLNSRDRVSPWTGSGEKSALTVWVVLGDVAANKEKEDKTEGLQARVFDDVDLDAPVTTLRWGAGKSLSHFDLSEFVSHY